MFLSPHSAEEIKCRESKDCDLVELSAKWDEMLLSVLVLSDSDTLGFHLLSGVLVRSISVMPTPSSVSTCEETFSVSVLNHDLCT